VVRVPPKLMAGARRAARSRGKSDAIDALAVARAAIREPDLPEAQLEGASRELRLLVDHREDLVCERTRIQNRLRWHLHEIDPELEPSGRSLGSLKLLDRLGRRLARREQSVQLRVARELVGHCRELTRQADRLEREIETLVRREAPQLLALPGCGALTAAKPVGEVAGIERFRTDAQLAIHAGVAPLDVSSGRQQRHRLNRAGNRQLNRALHTIAIVQKRTLEQPMGLGHSRGRRDWLVAEAVTSELVTGVTLDRHSAGEVRALLRVRIRAYLTARTPRLSPPARASGRRCGPPRRAAGRRWPLFTLGGLLSAIEFRPRNSAIPRATGSGR
jgi:Transposase IS116/IS110/IS902 family/Transposase